MRVGLSPILFIYVSRMGLFRNATKDYSGCFVWFCFGGKNKMISVGRMAGRRCREIDEKVNNLRLDLPLSKCSLAGPSEKWSEKA